MTEPSKPMPPTTAPAEDAAPVVAPRIAGEGASHTAEALSRPPLMNGLVSVAVIVAALYFGRDLLMPLALAILVGFVLDPMVSWLKRRGVPRALAVAIVVMATVALLLASAFFTE